MKYSLIQSTQTYENMTEEIRNDSEIRSLTQLDLLSICMKNITLTMMNHKTLTSRCLTDSKDIKCAHSHLLQTLPCARFRTRTITQYHNKLIDNSYLYTLVPLHSSPDIVKYLHLYTFSTKPIA